MGWGPAGNLFVLELARRLYSEVLHNFELGHFDDPLLQAIRTALLARSIPNEPYLSPAVWNVLWLPSLYRSVGDPLESYLGFLRCCGHLCLQ